MVRRCRVPALPFSFLAALAENKNRQLASKAVVDGDYETAYIGISLACSGCGHVGLGVVFGVRTPRPIVGYGAPERVNERSSYFIGEGDGGLL
jgi:hypothetical protein